MEKVEIDEIMEEEEIQDSLSIGSQSSQTVLSLIILFLLAGVLFFISRTLRQDALDSRKDVEEKSVELNGLTREKVPETMLV